MPVYYVIYTSVYMPGGWYVYRILKTIETTLEAVHDNLHQSAIQPFYVSGHNPQSMIFIREPDNPFRDSKSGTQE